MEQQPQLSQMGPWKCPVHSNKCTSRFVCAGTGRRVQGLPQLAREMNTVHSLVKQPSPQLFAHTSHSLRNPSPHMHTHSNMHVCGHTHAHTYTHIEEPFLLHICTCTRTCTCVGTHIHICTHAHTEELFSTLEHARTWAHTHINTHSNMQARGHAHTCTHACTLTEEPFFLLLIPPKRNLSPATRLPLPFFLESLAPLFFFLTPGPGRCNKGCNDQHCH